MRKFLLLGLAAACGSLVLTTPASASADRAAQRPVIRVMPLGDSITVGVGSSNQAGYRLPLWNLVGKQSRYAVDLVGSQRDGSFEAPWHQGQSGWMIGDLLNEVDGWLRQNTPDVVLLHIGINDLDRGADQPHAADRLKTLVDRIFTDRPTTTVIVQGLIPTTGGLESLTQKFNQQAHQLEPAEWNQNRHFAYTDAPALTAAEFADRLHPNDRGYARMADTFYTVLDQTVDLGWGVPDGPAQTPRP